MSPRSPLQSKSPKSTLPPPGPGWPRPLVEPNRSYAFRFSGSERTSYAVCTCLKRSSAPLSPWFVSGWNWRASLRYAFLISSDEAPFFTPSVSWSDSGIARGFLLRRRRGDHDPGGPDDTLAELVALLDDVEHGTLFRLGR